MAESLADVLVDQMAVLSVAMMVADLVDHWADE